MASRLILIGIVLGMVLAAAQVSYVRHLQGRVASADVELKSARSTIVKLQAQSTLDDGLAEVSKRAAETVNRSETVTVEAIANVKKSSELGDALAAYHSGLERLRASSPYDAATTGALGGGSTSRGTASAAAAN